MIWKILIRPTFLYFSNAFPYLFVDIDAEFQIHITLRKAYLLENLCFFWNFGIIKHITELI